MSILRSVAGRAWGAVKFVSGWNAVLRVKRLGEKALDVEGIKRNGADLVGKSNAKYRRETFEQAMARKGVSEKDLPEIEEGFVRRERFWRAVFLLSCALLVVYTVGWWAGLIVVLAMICQLGLMFAFLFSSAFRVWQIRKRKLLPVSAFLADGGLYRALIKNEA